MMKIFSIPTFTAICLLIMTICTSVAVAQTEISTIEDLNNMRKNLTGDYVLTKDLDFADPNSYASSTVNIGWRPQKGDGTVATTDQEIADAGNGGWTPIGEDQQSIRVPSGTIVFDSEIFKGTFDGRGFTISNLYVNHAPANRIYVGLFGAIAASSKIQNLGLLNSNIKVSGGIGIAYAGGIVAVNRGSIDNCYVEGTFTGKNTNNGSMIFGGLVGQNFSGTITNCYATGTLKGTTTSITESEGIGGTTFGGLVGGNSGTISNCYATGNISTEATNTGGGSIGGLVGSSSGTISNCYATGNVTGKSTIRGPLRIGGLAGGNGKGTISNCYATGNVSGTIGDQAKFSKPPLRIGGLVGDNNRSTISNSYATGNTSGTSTVENVQIGGLAGNNGSSSTISNCFWDKETTEQTNSAGSENTAGLSTTDLKALTATETATNEDDRWNTNDWEFGDNSQYPTLRSREAIDQNQAQGFIICNQPTNYVPCTTTPVLNGSPINFGNTAEPITRKMLIVAKNLSSNVTLSALEAPFSYAEGQALTFMSDFNRAIIPITFTPPNMAQTYNSSVTITGGGLTSNVVIAITGEVAPALTLNPTELAFGNLSTNATPTTQEYTITGTNLTEDVTLEIAGPGSTAFSITNPTNTTLTPADGALSQAVTITFNPTAEQEYTATITHTGGGLTSNVVLTITGTGTAPSIILNTKALENPSTTAIRLSPNPITDRLYIQGNGTLQVQCAQYIRCYITSY